MDIVGQARVVLGDGDVDLIVLLRAHGVERLAGLGHPVGHQGVGFEEVVDLLPLILRLHAEAGQQVVVEDVIKLAADDVVNGVLQPVAGEHQGGAAGDADEGHRHPLGVAEEVAGRHLIAEG